MRTRATKAAKTKGRTTKPRPRHAEEKPRTVAATEVAAAQSVIAEVLETYEDGSCGPFGLSTSKNTLEGLVRTYVFANGKC